MPSLVLVLAFVAICTTFEIVAPLEKHSAVQRLRGVSYQGVQIILGAALVYPVGQLIKAIGIGPVLPPIEQWAGIWAVPIVILAADFLAYWEHRFEHRFMWPVHAAHHSTTHLSAATNYAHPLQAIPMFLIIGVPLSFLNFSSVTIPMVAGLFFRLMLHFIHSPTRLHFGPLRHLVVDNRWHRIHHSLETKHWDRNFGISFSLWDRLFGTAHAPKAGEWPAVGVHGHPPPANALSLVFYPLRFLPQYSRRSLSANADKPERHLTVVHGAEALDPR